MQVKMNRAQERFFVKEEGFTAFLKYQLRGNSMVFLHTEVPRELEGQGIGSALAKMGLEYARENEYKVIVLCPFLQKYLQSHPEYQDLVQSSV